MNNLEIGNRIKQVRQEKGLSLRELGEIIGISGATIQRYENGLINRLKLPVIESIANALGVNPSWLIFKSKNKYKTLVNDKNTISSENKDLLNKFNKLSPNRQKRINKFIDMELEEQKEEEMAKERLG